VAVPLPPKSLRKTSTEATMDHQQVVVLSHTQSVLTAYSEFFLCTLTFNILLRG
jgi:hypothetical protein